MVTYAINPSIEKHSLISEFKASLPLQNECQTTQGYCSPWRLGGVRRSRLMSSLGASLNYRDLLNRQIGFGSKHCSSAAL